MARTTPVVGESLREQDLPTQTQTSAPIAPPPVERIAGVRIIRGGVWTGVSLRLAGGQTTPSLAAPDLMELSIVAGDGRSICIATVDNDEAVAVWRSASAATGLPMMIETADGLMKMPFPQFGRLALGPVRIRRAHRAMAMRRPRFLMRRKTGRLPDQPIIWRGVDLAPISSC